MSLAPSLAASLQRSMKSYRDALSEVFPIAVEILAPSNIDLAVVERYFRRAARLGVLHRLDPFDRAFLYSLRLWLSKGRRLGSRVVIDIARRILALIELSSLRGRAIALGILVAMRRGFRDMLSSVEELLVTGLQVINTPTAYRII